MQGARTIAAYALRESLRRRVFLVVLILTVSFLALYGLGVELVFRAITGLEGQELVEEEALVGGTMLGLAMFATLFLGAVLAVFLTFGAVRGDAERGLLQTLVVRPVGRRTLLLARYAAAAAVACGYALAVYAGAVLLTGAAGWWPDRILAPGLALAAAVAIVAALSLLGSVHLSATACGIGVFMLFGAGLTAGLLAQIGDALDVGELETAGQLVAWLLPFEALYQAGLERLTTDTGGVTGVAISLGPFGGAQEGGPLLWAWALGYLALVGAAAVRSFERRDL